MHQLRLADCDASSCCRVEILHDDEWGTLCDDTSSSDDRHHLVANVICAQVPCWEAYISLHTFNLAMVPDVHPIFARWSSR